MLMSLLLTAALSSTNTAPARPVVAVDAAAPAASIGVPHGTTRYCVIDRITGSHIPVKLCRTADEWIAREGQVPTGRIKTR